MCVPSTPILILAEQVSLDDYKAIAKRGSGENLSISRADVSPLLSESGILRVFMGLPPKCTFNQQLVVMSAFKWEAS